MTFIELDSNSLASKVVPLLDTLSDEDRQRVITCIHACDGIPSEELDPPGLSRGVDADGAHLGYIHHRDTVACEMLSTLREFYAAGGLDSVPAGCHVRPSLSYEYHARGYYLPGRQVGHNTYQYSAAKRIIEANRGTVVE